MLVPDDSYRGSGHRCLGAQEKAAGGRSTVWTLRLPPRMFLPPGAPLVERIALSYQGVPPPLRVLAGIRAEVGQERALLIGNLLAFAFALRGSIDKITNRVFLLSPPNVDVTAEGKRRLSEGTFFNYG